MNRFLRPQRLAQGAILIGVVLLYIWAARGVEFQWTKLAGSFQIIKMCATGECTVPTGHIQPPILAMPHPKPAVIGQPFQKG